MMESGRTAEQVCLNDEAAGERRRCMMDPGRTAEQVCENDGPQEYEKRRMRLKRRICIMLAVLCLAGLYAVRVYAVNTGVRLPVRQVFEKGEVVPFGKDYNISEGDCCDGYTIQVLESKIMTEEEFFQEYEEADDMGLASHYYMVKVKVGNAGNEYVGEQGVHMGTAMLVGTNYSVILSPDMFRAVNPDMETASFSLRLGTEMEMWLVFQIIPGNTPEYEHIVKNPPMLQITQYPRQKLIRITDNL